MKKITIIIGLPGSGKTQLLYKFAGRIKDDICFLSKEEVKEMLAEPYEEFAVADPRFCDAKVLQNFVSHIQTLDLFQIRYIYFENNPEQCLANRSQTERDTINTIARLTKIYKPVNPIPVWRPDNLQLI